MPSSVLVRVVFGVLVLATSAAFLVAQRLKRSTPIVDKVYYPQYIGPDCHCPKASANFYFALRHPGRVRITIVDEAGDDVRTLMEDRRLSRRRHRFLWNGRTDAGVVAPDGAYHLRVILPDQARSVTLSRRIVLDTIPPRPRIVATNPAEILPGAPGALGRARISFKGDSNPAPLIQVYRTDGPKPQLVDAFQAHRGRHTAFWAGMANGKPAPDGVYALTLTTYDRAGNAGSWPPHLPPTPAQARPGTGVSVRYLTVKAPLEPVAAGATVRFKVGPVPRRLRWSLGPPRLGRPIARGGGKAGTLAVRIPRDAPTGLYLLRVVAAGHRAVQPVAIQGGGRGRVLVVLPAIAWQGGNRVDDDGDGFANTLAGGQSVREVRPFAHGLPPAGLTDSIDPLLRFLARERVPYTLTTDLALAQGAPDLSRYGGVLFAGDETWLTNRLDLALRAYVESGGRVASFGTDSFRRRVSLGRDELTGPTPPEQVNVFGEQTAPLHIAEAPMVVNQPDALGLFRGVVGGLLGGFTQFEQSQRLVPGAQILSSAGRDPRHPAFIAYRLGKGIVVRTGTSAWNSKLAGDIELTDVTRRIWSLLSR